MTIRDRVCLVMPLAYDDTLSYYECVAKLVNKVNEIVEVDNQQSSIISELSAQSTERYNRFEQRILDDLASMKVDLEQEIESGDQTLQEAFSAMVAEVSDSVDSVADRVTTVEGDLDTISDGLGAVEISVENVNTRLNGVEYVVNRVDGRISQNETDIGGLKNSVSVLRNDVDELMEGGSITVDSQLSTVSENPVQNKVITGAIDLLGDSLDVVVGSVNQLSGEVDSLNESVGEVINTVNALDTLIDNVGDEVDDIISGETVVHSATNAVSAESADNASLLDNHDSSYYTDSSNIEFDNSGTDLTSTDVQSAIVELGESVADGKALVASAITNKGVTTASDASFATMASNIGEIPSGVKHITVYSGWIDPESYMGMTLTASHGLNVTPLYVFASIESNNGNGYLSLNTAGGNALYIWGSGNAYFPLGNTVLRAQQSTYIHNVSVICNSTSVTMTTGKVYFNVVLKVRARFEIFY